MISGFSKRKDLKDRNLGAISGVGTSFAAVSALANANAETELKQHQVAMGSKPAYAARLEAYESTHPGTMESHLAFVEVVARRLFTNGRDQVVVQMAADDSRLQQNLAATYDLSELEFQTHTNGVCDEKIPLTPAFYRIAAAEMLGTEQAYYNRTDTARGYAIAGEVVTHNNTPFAGFAPGAVVSGDQLRFE